MKRGDIMDNVIYYQDVMNKKMNEQIKILDKNIATPKKLHKQIRLLNDWYVNELSQEEDN